ncbi:MAG TPA: LytTR family DNA-binding domain-containing protein [Mucilaginibacter sp.]|nr:LytTR family DNA-binding domain-containing protein [Mucilaginibacter sp.]
MINCLIVDDEPVARSIIRNYCEQLSFLNVIAECGNALEAKEILTTQKIDLLFLDIHMPVLNGVSFLNTLRHPPQVIFTTAYQEHAVTAFDLAACDYLLKPFSLERFIIAVDKAKEKQHPAFPGNEQSKPDCSFFIKAEGKLHQVFYNDCLYAEAQGNYTKVVTAHTSILTKKPFSALTALLPGDLFVRTHRSFIINKAHIRYIEGNRVFITDKEIPLATAYRDSFLNALK